jgi:hypothetical protein
MRAIHIYTPSDSIYCGRASYRANAIDGSVLDLSRPQPGLCAICLKSYKANTETGVTDETVKNT